MVRAVAGALALAVAASLTGCLAGCTGPSRSAAPVIPQAPRPTTMAGYYAQQLTWMPCGTGFECARLYVPLDYAHPAGAVFSLPVVKLPAAAAGERIGALVINPGGPGGSGVEYARSARSGEFTKAILARFDIVGFDPRAVGGSTPALRCLTGPQLDKYLAVNEAPADAAQLATVVAVSKAYAAACARNARGLLPYVGTAAAARDLDILRAALGQSRLTYLGKSYGTVLGASYAQQFPSRVRAAVLDGAVAPQVSGIDLDIAQAQGFESAFVQFAAWCSGQASCPLHPAHGVSGPGVMAGGAIAEVAGLIRQANARPLASELPGGQPANGAMLLLGIAAALYSKSAWPILRGALSQALNSGDGSVLVELADSLVERSPNGTYSNLTDVGTAVSCVDRAYPASIAAWRAAAATAARVAPLFGPTLVWGSLPCAYWPVRPSPVLAGSSAGRRTAVPALVVGDLHDPATPYAGSGALARWLPSGVLLGWNGEGHTSYMEGDNCVDTAVDAYLIRLQLPRNGTVCQ